MKHLSSARRAASLAFFCLCFFCLSSKVSAEPVLIQTRSGAEGQGWLFGSPRDGKCWVLTPAHVVASPETGKVEPFYFTDGRGHSRQCSIPMQGASGRDAASASNSANDLVFAKVVTGAQNEVCQSRLGLPALAYQRVIAGQNNYSIQSLLKTSRGVFPVTIERNSVDEYGGSIIDFHTEKTYADKYFRKGLSGAIVSNMANNDSTPVAMVVEIKNNGSTARAIRFDRIRTLFENLTDDIKLETSPTAQGAPYNVIYSEGTPIEGDQGVSSIQLETGCWRSSPSAGMKTVNLVLESTTQNMKIDYLEVVQTPECKSGQIRYWIDQRVSSDNAWTYVTKCEQDSLNVAPCRISLPSPRQLRIRFDAGNELSISGIRLR